MRGCASHHGHLEVRERCHVIGILEGGWRGEERHDESFAGDKVSGCGLPVKFQTGNQYGDMPFLCEELQLLLLLPPPQIKSPLHDSVGSNSAE